MSEASTSVMKLYASGGTVLVRCLRPRSADGVSRSCASFPDGSGTSTRSS